MNLRKFICLCGLLILITGLPALGGCFSIPLGSSTPAGTGASPAPTPELNSIKYLEKIMDQYHGAVDVYSDAYAAGNHFWARGKENSPGGYGGVPAMDEACAEGPHSGKTCIKAAFLSKKALWGGWYFLNGASEGMEVKPKENWGDFPNAGVNLTGATELTFWARGAKGDERVEFFMGGVGAGSKPYPDSAPKVTGGTITLTNSWKQYKIDLNNKDLSYVLGGFGWQATAADNNGQDIIFYLDDIQYNKARLNEPRFLVSYEPEASDPIILRSMASVYDNALAIIAFLAAGRRDRAKSIAEALIYATQHDPAFADGRIRNAYQGGDLNFPAGWTINGKTGVIRWPGWYDPAAGIWREDESQIASGPGGLGLTGVTADTGSAAWAILALLTCYQIQESSQYLPAAEALGEWIEDNCRDARGEGGYTQGFTGQGGKQVKLAAKSTGDNLALYAAFQRLYAIKKDLKWSERARQAKKFVTAMWDAEAKKFWAGTESDGVTISRKAIPLYVQAWAALALKEDANKYQKALSFVETHYKVGGGFDYNDDLDGVWYEGTAQMAAAYKCLGGNAKAQTLIASMKAGLLTAEGLPAAGKDGLTTGLAGADGRPVVYNKRPHVGTNAWLALAEMGVNPFWYGEK
ncbi:MAG: hypothetical protein K6U80_17620 [Firmicutes bacterium]|nr:hypothetical protein [Bacillota bacterium]